MCSTTDLRAAAQSRCCAVTSTCCHTNHALRLGISTAAAAAFAASVAAPSCCPAKSAGAASVQWPMQDVEVINKIGGPTKVIKVGGADVAATVRSLHTPQLVGSLTTSTSSVVAAAAANNIMRTVRARQTRCHGCLRTATHAASFAAMLHRRCLLGRSTRPTSQTAPPTTFLRVRQTGAMRGHVAGLMVALTTGQGSTLPARLGVP